MKLYIYKDELCDPAKKIGTAKYFSSARELDEYVASLVANIRPSGLKRFRIFITNDEIEFANVDHFVTMDEYIFGTRSRIKEVNMHELALQVNPEYQARHKQISEALARRERAWKQNYKAYADKVLDDLAKQTTEPSSDNGEDSG